METTLPASVFLCLPSEWAGNDWESLCAAFEKSGLLLKQSPFSPYYFEFYHPDAAIVLSEGALSKPSKLTTELFENLSPIVPIVSIISQRMWDREQDRDHLMKVIFHPPLHEYVFMPFDIDELILRVKQVIEANIIDDEAKTRIIKQVRTLWDHQAEEAGKLIFERIPRRSIPFWAANILEVVSPYFPPSPRIEAVLEFARNPLKWAKTDDETKRMAHCIVDEACPYPYTQPQPWEHLVFELAKDVGKLTYNMYGYPAPFDTSAGWGLAQTLKEITNRINDASFEERVWAALCNPEYILLKLPWLAYTFFK